MRIKYLVVFFIITLAANKTYGSGKNDKVVNIVLLGGQSNMEGAGNYNDLSDELKERLNAIKDRVQLVNDGKPAEPLNYYYSEYQKNRRGFGECFGPELFIGLILAENSPDEEFLFIKRAQGGTSLYGAWNPEWSAEKSKEVETGTFKQEMKIYNEHIIQINKVIDQLTKEGKRIKIIGMCWMQGENDASKEVSARAYEVNLKKLITAYRKEFKIEKMPFIIGQINSRYGKFADGPKIVRQAMVNIANNVENCDIIKTSTDTKWIDFPKHTDNVHYNAIGQLRLGTAFGMKLLEFVK